MSRVSSVCPTVRSARTRLERARASCQQLMEELGNDRMPTESARESLVSSDRGVIS